MRHGLSNIGQDSEIQRTNTNSNNVFNIDFVLEKSIFSSIFEKDIRRVFIYKKAERLAKAIYLIAPAFLESVSLKNRIDGIALGLIDAALLSPNILSSALSREILSLSSVLSIARASNILSPMNVELISREAHTFYKKLRRMKLRDFLSMKHLHCLLSPRRLFREGHLRFRVRQKNNV